MKKLISVLVVACFFLISLASAGSARVYNEPGKHQVGASIGQDEYGLVRKPATFTIAPGFRASGLKVVGLDPGREYGTGKAIERSGFTLKGPGFYYRWERTKDSSPVETGGPLGGLDLGEGTYTLSVDGGSGAYVTLEFTLSRPGIPTGPRHSVVEWAPDRLNDGYIWVPAGKVATGFTIKSSTGGLGFSILDPAGNTKFRYSRSSRSEKPGESPCSLGELHLESNEKGWYFLQADEGSHVNLEYEQIASQGAIPVDVKGARITVEISPEPVYISKEEQFLEIRATVKDGKGQPVKSIWVECSLRDSKSVLIENPGLKNLDKRLTDREGMAGFRYPLPALSEMSSYYGHPNPGWEVGKIRDFPVELKVEVSAKIGSEPKLIAEKKISIEVDAEELILDWYEEAIIKGGVRGICMNDPTTIGGRLKNWTEIRRRWCLEWTAFVEKNDPLVPIIMEMRGHGKIGRCGDLSLYIIWQLLDHFQYCIESVMRHYVIREISIQYYLSLKDKEEDEDSFATHIAPVLYPRVEFKKSKQIWALDAYYRTGKLKTYQEWKKFWVRPDLPKLSKYYRFYDDEAEWPGFFLGPSFTKWEDSQIKAFGQVLDQYLSAIHVGGFRQNPPQKPPKDPPIEELVASFESAYQRLISSPQVSFDKDQDGNPELVLLDVARDGFIDLVMLDDNSDGIVDLTVLDGKRFSLEVSKLGLFTEGPGIFSQYGARIETARDEDPNIKFSENIEKFHLELEKAREAKPAVLTPRVSDAVFSPKEYEELAHAEVELTLLSTRKPYPNVKDAMISADGNRVVYVCGPGPPDAVMVVNSDGTGEKEIFRSFEVKDPYHSTNLLQLHGTPYISGDGNTVAFPVWSTPPEETYGPMYLAIYNWNGSWQGPTVVQFNNLADPDYSVISVKRPSISDDGASIVLEINFRLWDEYYSCIASTNKAGRSPTELLRSGGGAPVLISGNGKRIVFAGKETGDWESGYVLWSMNADGSDLTKIKPTGSVPDPYSVPYYSISSDGRTTGFLANFPAADGWQYVLVDARDGSNVRTIHTFEGKCPGSPQITPDGEKVYYCSAIYDTFSFYRKNSDNSGDLVILDGNSENLPWEHVDVWPGTHSFGGDQRFNMDRTGSRFLVIKEKDRGDYDLYLVRIKGEEAESVVRKVEISEPRPAREKPDGERAENLTSNPDFSQGLENWIIEEHGYYDPDILHPYSLGTYLPDASKGYLEMGVYGGYYYASQVVPVSSIDLQFRCEMKVESWSTYQEKEVGLVATTISFLDEKDDFLGALHYYLRPDYSHESTLKDRWIKLSEETETPTDWYEVEVSLQQVLQEELGIGGESIRKMVITVVVFGTHEDKTYTVGYFDNFYLGEKGASL